MKKIIIWGATGQLIVLEEFLDFLDYKIIALFDNNREIQSPLLNISIYHGYKGFEEWKKSFFEENVFFLVAIGGNKGRARLQIHEFLEKNGIKPAVAIHPTAFVAKNAIIDRGCQILANSAVCARTEVGKSTIINTSASIDHECTIGNGVHIGPGAKIAGCVKIGDYSFIGTGAIILPKIEIGKNVVIGAGSVVLNNLPDNITAYGNPSRIIKKKIEK